jgi:hypothetical protein
LYTTTTTITTTTTTTTPNIVQQQHQQQQQRALFPKWRDGILHCPQWNICVISEILQQRRRQRG